MMCPFCLREAQFALAEKPLVPVPVFECPNCKEFVPTQYVREYQQVPNVVVSVVGFQGHGKTVYLTALFTLIDMLATLGGEWRTFYSAALNDHSLDVVQGNIESFKQGVLPPQTLKNFPKPTIVRLGNMPLQSANLLIYDTGGESFERASSIGQFANFVRYSHSVIFVISVKDLDPTANLDRQMHRLLQTYANGLNDLQGNVAQQRLIVVYTKADELGGPLAGYKPVAQHLSGSELQELRAANVSSYLEKLTYISACLRAFTADQLQAHQFVHMAENSFKSVDFCAVSATGVRPNEKNRLPLGPRPHRVLDPLLMLIYYSRKPKPKGFWRW